MIKKALIKFEGNTYWLDMTSGFPIVETQNPDGTFRDTLKTEIDVFDLMETGEVVGDKKPEPKDSEPTKVDNKKIPDGLYRCEKCGEYKGKVMEKDLNWTDSFDKENREKSEEYITVSCLCDGVLCPKCKSNKIHRPISNSYDEKNNTIGHWPYFTGMAGCEECRRPPDIK